MDKIRNRENSEAAIEFVMINRTKSVSAYSGYFIIKRFFDIFFSAFFLILFIPFFLIISLAILIEDKSSSPIYKSSRIGRYGQKFNIYKFRSMKKGSDNLEKMLTKEQLDQYNREFKITNDPRITKVGNILRKTSIDELPQLVNVLKGDMSLIGPRPVLMSETFLYGKDRDKFLSIRPGITGYWQAYARNAVGYKDGERQKMELYYVENKSFLLDIKIIFKTFYAVIKRSGV